MSWANLDKMGSDLLTQQNSPGIGLILVWYAQLTSFKYLWLFRSLHCIAWNIEGCDNIVGGWSWGRRFTVITTTRMGKTWIGNSMRSACCWLRRFPRMQMLFRWPLRQARNEWVVAPIGWCLSTRLFLQHTLAGSISEAQESHNAHCHE